MSVIFQALQKLEPLNGEMPSLTDEVPAAAKKSSPKRRLLLRGVVLIVAVFVLVGLGYGAVYGVRRLADRLQQAPEPPADPRRYAVHRKPPPTSGHSDPPAKQEAAAAQPAQVQYYPPEAPPPSDRPAAAATAHPSSPAPVTETSRPAYSPQATAAAASRMARSNPAMRPLQDETAPYGSAGFPEASTSLSPGRSDPAWQAAEAARLAAFEKSARIGRLVRRIEVCLHNAGDADSDQKAERLMAELTRLKGADSAYVIKLKAYQLMKAGHYKKAERLLKKLLAGHANDLEAGLNLAVIEINTGRADQARQRLKKFRDLYPDNAAIADLLRKLK